MLDTDVLAAAAATRGLCADVLRAVLADSKMIICPQIISELQRVLKDKFALPGFLINDYVWLIQQDSIPCGPGDLPVTRLKDKDDLGILSAAIGKEKGGKRCQISISDLIVTVPDVTPRLALWSDLAYGSPLYCRAPGLGMRAVYCRS